MAARRDTARRLVPVLGTAVGSMLALVVIIGFIPQPGTVWQRQIELATYSLGGLAGWVVLTLRPTRSTTLLAAAALLILAPMALSTAVSKYPTLSIPALWHGIAAAGVALLVLRWTGSPTGARTARVVVLVVATVVMAAYALEVAGYWVQWLQLGGSVTGLPVRPGSGGGLYHAPTTLADYVVLLVPITVVTLWRAGRGGQAWGLALAMVGVAELLVSGTRSLVILAIVCACVLLVAWAVRRRPSAIRWRPLVVVPITLAALAAVALVATSLMARFAGNLDEGRLATFRVAIDIWARFPLLGGGPGTFGEWKLGLPSDVHYVVPTAFNVVLTALAETGILGVSTMVAAAVIGVRGLIAAWRTAGSDRSLIVAGTCGLGLALAHAMVDQVIDVPGVFLVSLIVGGLVLGQSTLAPDPVVPRRNRSIGPAGALTGLAGLLALAALLPGLLTVEGSVADQAEARDALAAGNAQSALALAQRASDATPDSAPALLLLALAQDANDHPNGAVTTTLRLVALEPAPQHVLRLAMLYDELGGHQYPLTLLRSVLGRTPPDPVVLLNAAVLFTAAGDTQTTDTVLASLIERQPWLALRQEDLPAGVEDRLSMATATATTDLTAAGRWDDALSAALAVDDRPLAARIAGDSEPAGRAMRQLAVAAWYGDASATTTLNVAAHSGTGALSWALQVAGHACARSDLERLLPQYRIVTGSQPMNPTRIGRTPAVHGGPEPALYPSVIWQVDAPLQQFPRGTWSIEFGPPGSGC